MEIFSKIFSKLFQNKEVEIIKCKTMCVKGNSKSFKSIMIYVDPVDNSYWLFPWHPILPWGGMSCRALPFLKLKIEETDMPTLFRKAIEWMEQHSKMVDEEYDNTYVRSGEFDRDFIKATKLRSVSTLDNRSTARISIYRLCDMDDNCKLYYEFITWKCCPKPPRKGNGRLINRIYKPIDTPEEELIATMVEALKWQQNHPEPEPRKRKRKVQSDTANKDDQ